MCTENWQNILTHRWQTRESATMNHVTSLRNRKHALRMVQELDAFPKVPESYQETSATGGGSMQLSWLKLNHFMEHYIVNALLLLSHVRLCVHLWCTSDVNEQRTLQKLFKLHDRPWIWICCEKAVDRHSQQIFPRGLLRRRDMKKITILTSISQCRGNDTRYGHSYNAICRMVSFPMTLSNPNLDSKVQITWKLYEITHSGFAVYLPGLCGLAG